MGFYASFARLVGEEIVNEILKKANV